MLLRLSEASLAIDGWSRSDLIALVGVFVMLVAILVAIWTVRYKVKVRAYRDSADVVAVVVKNRGRVAASLGPVRRVVRRSLPGRLLRSMLRRENPIVTVDDGQPAVTLSLAPNEEKTWHLPPEHRHPCMAPRPWRPFAEPELRPLRPGEAIFEISCGARRARYVRNARAMRHRFQRVPREIAEQLPLDASPEPAPPPKVPPADQPHPPPS